MLFFVKTKAIPDKGTALALNLYFSKLVNQIITVMIECGKLVTGAAFPAIHNR